LGWELIGIDLCQPSETEKETS